MRIRGLSVALLLVSGCITLKASLAPHEMEAVAAAVRYMEADMREPQDSRPLRFLEVLKRDPAPALLHAVSDLGILPASRAKYSDGPTPLLIVTDKRTGTRGDFIRIKKISIKSASEIEIEVFYGITGSILTVRREGSSWLVAEEDIKYVVVASRDGSASTGAA